MAVSSRDKASNRRPRAFGDSDDDDDAHLASSSSRHQEIVSFGRDGAHGRKRSPAPAAPRVIPVASNLDWRQDRRQRLGLASNLQSLGPLVSMRRADSSVVPGSDASAPANGDVNTDAINTEAQKGGLEVRKSRPRQDDSEDAPQPQGSAAVAAPSEAPEEVGTDQEALKALLSGQAAGSTNNGEPLVIHQQSESELLHHDIDTRPEAPTLDDYAATPIDQFGMALLRGMGWKEGMGAGKGGKGPQQAAEPKKRAALLGLGAKERPAGALGLPSSGSSSARSHRPKDKRDYKYVPVARTDQQSGSNGRSDSTHKEDRSSEHRSRDKIPSRDDSRRDRDHRHTSSRDSSRYERHRSSPRPRSRSPTRSRDDERDRHRDPRRDDRDSERRSHGSSRSDRDRRSERDRDDRRREHRR